MYCWSSVRVTYLQFYLLLPDSGNRYCQLSKGIKYGQPSAVVGCHQSSAAIRYCQPSVGVTVSDLQVLGILLPICRCWGILLPICRCWGILLPICRCWGILLAICRCWEYCSPSAGPRHCQPGWFCWEKPCKTCWSTLHLTSLQYGSKDFAAGRFYKHLLQDGSTRTYCRMVPHAPTAGRFHMHLLQDGSTRTYCRTVPHAPHHKTAAGEKQE